MIVVLTLQLFLWGLSVGVAFCPGLAGNWGGVGFALGIRASAIGTTVEASVLGRLARGAFNVVAAAASLRAVRQLAFVGGCGMLVGADAAPRPLTADRSGMSLAEAVPAERELSGGVVGGQPTDLALEVEGLDSDGRHVIVTCHRKDHGRVRSREGSSW